MIYVWNRYGGTYFIQRGYWMLTRRPEIKRIICIQIFWPWRDAKLNDTISSLHKKMNTTQFFYIFFFRRNQPIAPFCWPSRFICCLLTYPHVNKRIQWHAFHIRGVLVHSIQCSSSNEQVNGKFAKSPGDAYSGVINWHLAVPQFFRIHSINWFSMWNQESVELFVLSGNL